MKHINTLSQMRGKLAGIPRKLHRDQDGQMILLAAVFLFILVMALAVPIRLSVSVRQKIQAQNAVDAAAITGGIWQLRGLNVVQGMNDLMFLMDSLALTGLTAGAILGPCTAIPLVGQSFVLAAGNIALAVGTVSHFGAQFVISPLRDIVAHGWSVLCYIGASESAKANEASKIFEASPEFLGGLIGQLDKQFLPTAGIPGLGSGAFDEAVPEDMPEHDGGFMAAMLKLIKELDIYALGFEMNLPANDSGGNLDYMTDIVGSMANGDGMRLMWLHVERKTGADHPPLKIDRALLKNMLLLAKPLVPMSVAAHVYFAKAGWVQVGLDRVFTPINCAFLGDKCKKKEVENNGLYLWDHAWYESVVEEGKNLAVLPTVTWIALVRPGRLSFSGWNKMGGLGVPSGIGSSNYGELGAMAMASANLAVDPVRQVRFGGVDGFVALVPVKITDNDDQNSFIFGICH
jgi:hypothetical protein